MKKRTKDADALRALQKLPWVGPATARDFLRLGLRSPEEIAPLDPDELYERLCRLDGIRLDPCVRDVFAAAIDAARGRPPRPWWHYSRRCRAR